MTRPGLFIFHILIAVSSEDSIAAWKLTEALIGSEKRIYIKTNNVERFPSGSKPLASLRWICSLSELQLGEQRPLSSPRCLDGRSSPMNCHFEKPETVG